MVFLPFPIFHTPSQHVIDSLIHMVPVDRRETGLDERKKVTNYASEIVDTIIGPPPIQAMYVFKNCTLLRWQIFKHFLILFVTLSDFLNLTLLHPSIQVLRVHSFLDTFSRQVAFSLLHSSCVLQLPHSFLLLKLFPFRIELICKISKRGSWIFVMLLSDFFML